VRLYFRIIPAGGPYSSYWSLFDGSNAGFGKNTKGIFTNAGNVSIAAHMNGFLLEAGTRSSFADPTAVCHRLHKLMLLYQIIDKSYLPDIHMINQNQLQSTAL